MHDAPTPPVPAMVIHCCNLLREQLGVLQGRSGLLVGCGSGHEVIYMRRTFPSDHIVGLDVETTFSPEALAEGCVLAADAKQLPFRSGTFDFAASFHSLEHVGDPRPALDEVRRVLRPGGWFYVGVPNRSRLVGYLGSFDATTWQKITWYLADWSDRIRGRFQNVFGSHAGVEGSELLQLLGEQFSNVRL